MGTLEAVPAASFFDTAEKEEGRGVVGRPLPTKRESQVVWAIPVQLRGSMSSTVLVYTRGIDICWVHQVINVFLPLSGHRQFLVYTRSSTFLHLYQVISDSLFIPGEASYSHQWPLCGECFFGLYTPEERFLGRLCVWRLNEHDPRLWDDSGQRFSSNRPVSGMSTMARGRSVWCRAAASGRAASISSRVSGRAAHSSG